MSTSQRSVVFKMLRVYVGVLCLLAIFAYLNPINKSPTLYQINHETHDILHSLIKTKYFRMLRVNLNRQCELYVRNKICKSKSCTVCRCDQKDIPLNWVKTDKVKEQFGGSLDIWGNQRQLKNKSLTWIWHVEDQQNDQGQYFDLDKNIQSFTSYNGSTIWKMVYQQNCFNAVKDNKYQNSQCKEQNVFYKVISGLHTSISSHLTRFYKNITSQSQMWADLKTSDQFYVNYNQYQRRVLNHPDRVQNLLFIYQIYLRAIKQISPYMLRNYTISSQSIVEDLHTTELLHNLSKKFQKYQFHPFDTQLKSFFYAENPKVQYYQKYIHNISRLMNCVECQKCRLYGKMQTYGIGTALKILLGYNNFYKRNQMVALYNAWNKISMSVDFYYKTVGIPETELQYDFFWFRLFATVAGSFIIFIFLVEKINIRQKVKHLFKNVKFPSQRPTKNISRSPIKKEPKRD